MKRTIAITAAMTAAFLAGCSGSVAPSGAFLTLNVSAREITVKTSVNGKANDFLSGGASGDLVASAPLNNALHEGENEIVFILKKSESVSGAFEPSFNAALELAGGGEIVDTTAPNARVIFTRDLHEEEAASLDADEEVTISEKFELSREKLKAMAKKAP